MDEKVIEEAENIVRSASHVIDFNGGELAFAGKGYEAKLYVEKGRLEFRPSPE